MNNNIINLINKQFETNQEIIIENNIDLIIKDIKSYDDVYAVFEEYKFESEEQLCDCIVEIAVNKELMQLLKEGRVSDFRKQFNFTKPINRKVTRKQLNKDLNTIRNYKKPNKESQRIKRLHGLRMHRKAATTYPTNY
jgi:ABC-type uncharacterized transport system ATPase subunit